MVPFIFEGENNLQIWANTSKADYKIITIDHYSITILRQRRDWPLKWQPSTGFGPKTLLKWLNISCWKIKWLQRDTKKLQRDKTQPQSYKGTVRDTKYSRRDAASGLFGVECRGLRDPHPVRLTEGVSVCADASINQECVIPYGRHGEHRAPQRSRGRGDVTGEQEKVRMTNKPETSDTTTECVK